MNTLKINGQSRDFPDGLPKTLSDLLILLKMNQATVVAEVDKQIERSETAVAGLLYRGLKRLHELLEEPE